MPFAILRAPLRLFVPKRSRGGRTFTLQNCNPQLRQFSQLYTSSSLRCPKDLRVVTYGVVIANLYRAPIGEFRRPSVEVIYCI